jgi:hypothetical protein
VPADGAPRREGAGERLVHQVLRRVLIADADNDSAQAVIRGSAVELREVQLLGSSTYLTHNRWAADYYLARALLADSGRAARPGTPTGTRATQNYLPGAARTATLGPRTVQNARYCAAALPPLVTASRCRHRRGQHCPSSARQAGPIQS